MELYLVRHGAALSEGEDDLRPLSREGRIGVETVSHILEPLQLKIDRIEHSSKLRARQTAELLGRALRPLEGTF